MDDSKKGAAGAILAALAVVSALLFGNVGRTPGLYEIPATQDIAYRIADRPAQDLSGAISYARAQLKRPAHRGEGYVIRTGGMEWSRPRPLGPALERYSARLSSAKVGQQWTIKAVKDQFRLFTLKVDLNPAKITNTEGTQAVDIIVGTLRSRHPNLRIGGIYVCRTTIYGGVSQHMYANAVDVSGSFTDMKRAAYDLLSLMRQGYVPVSQILWDHRNLVTGHYVYDHTDHVHFSGAPLMSGACRRP